MRIDDAVAGPVELQAVIGTLDAIPNQLAH